MIRITRDIIGNGESVNVDQSVKDIMLERGYILGHTGVENGVRFMEFDGSFHQETRDYENGIIDSILKTRFQHRRFLVSWKPEFSRLGR